MSVQAIDQGESTHNVWRLSWVATLAVGAVALLSVLAFWDGLARMWDWWLNVPEYSHGLLIPPVAAFLVWQQKDRLERMPFTGSVWGVALVVLGGALLFLGQLGTVFTAVQYGFIVTLYGLILAFVGPRAFRILAVPLFILLFMIPLPEFILTNLSRSLQLLSSQVGVWLIRQFGISVYLEGNVIDLGGYKLQVAEACSGLRYLFPLMTLGFLMAYFYKGALWKRIVLFLSSMPITMLMNSFRVGIIGITVEHWGIAMAEGFLHELQGWMVFMISAAMMLGEIALLNVMGRESGSWRQLFGVELPAPTPRGIPVSRRAVPIPFIVAGALIATFVVVTLVVPRPAEETPSRVSFVEFPNRLAGWQGSRESLDGVFTDQLKLDDYLLSTYVKDDAAVNLYIAWYNSQRKGEAVHSPRSCLPGGGWEMRDFGQRELQGLSIQGVPLRVNRSIVQLGDQRQLVYYWFQQRGRVIDNEFAVKWYLFWDALTRHRTDGALVRLITPVPSSTGLAAADQRLSELAALIAPDLPRYIPN